MAFNEDLRQGEIGERIAWIHLLESLKIRQVMDVRKDKYFQNIDIDFLALRIDGQVLRVEVKTDRQAHKTGNIVFETKSNSNKGCLLRSEADWIYYYLSETNETLIIEMEKLQGFIIHKQPQEVPMGDNARGYLLSIQELIDYQVAIRR